MSRPIKLVIYINLMCILAGCSYTMKFGSSHEKEIKQSSIDQALDQVIKADGVKSAKKIKKEGFHWGTMSAPESPACTKDITPGSSINVINCGKL